MSADLHEIYPTIVTIKDFPCGSGKTTKMMQELCSDKLYLIVVPLKTEIHRVLEATSHLGFVEPLEAMTPARTKQAALLKLTSQRKSIVTTHRLYSDIGHLAALGCLQEYNVIIDEVPEVINPVISLSKRSVDDFYISPGYLEISEGGLCRPTVKWERTQDDVSDTLNEKIKKHAEGQNLYLTAQGTFLTAVPKMLFYQCVSITILTYKPEGSYLLEYLKKLGVHYNLRRDQIAEEMFKAKAHKLITFADTLALEKVNFTYSKQTKYSEKSKETQIVRSGLKNWRARYLKGVPLENVMVTCAEANWRDSKAFKSGTLQLRGFAKTTGLGKVHWVANQTRGTNDYSHCSHLVYLYDKHPMPPITQWLGCPTKEFSDAYGLTELIQWIWRSRIRNGQPVTLYIPSPRMKRLLLDWLNS